MCTTSFETCKQRETTYERQRLRGPSSLSKLCAAPSASYSLGQLEFKVFGVLRDSWVKNYSISKAESQPSSPGTQVIKPWTAHTQWYPDWMIAGQKKRIEIAFTLDAGLSWAWPVTDWRNLWFPKMIWNERLMSFAVCDSSFAQCHISVSMKNPSRSGQAFFPCLRDMLYKLCFCFKVSNEGHICLSHVGILESIPESNTMLDGYDRCVRSKKPTCS